MANTLVRSAFDVYEKNIKRGIGEMSHPDIRANCFQPHIWLLDCSFGLHQGDLLLVRGLTPGSYHISDGSSDLN